MGQGNSVPERELPYSKTDATLYYFGGRGKADQIRWMLAYSDVSFTQRIMNKRERFLNLVENGQLAFGKLPLLQVRACASACVCACVCACACMEVYVCNCTSPPLSHH